MGPQYSQLHRIGGAIQGHVGWLTPIVTVGIITTKPGYLSYKPTKLT